MSRRLCIPWSPSVFVTTENARALWKAASSPTPQGRLYGRAGGELSEEELARIAAGLPTYATPKARGGLEPGVVASKSGRSWAKGSAKYVSASENVKLSEEGGGQIDATYVSIASTCVDCFLAPKGGKIEVEIGDESEVVETTGVCYTLGSHTAAHVKEADTIARQIGETSEQASLSEAACIRSSYFGQRIPPKTDLRIHTVGDASTVVGARAVSAAVADWKERGGRDAYTYTHAWRRVPRSAWGNLSVLASLNPYDDVADALKNGYHAVSVMVSIELWRDKFDLKPLVSMTEAQAAKAAVKGKRLPGSLVFRAIDIGEEGRGLRFFPCPAQSPVDRDKESGEPSSHEAMKFKASLLASRAKLSERDARGEVVHKGAPFPTLEKAAAAFAVKFDKRGLPIIDENHKAYTRYRKEIVAAGFPDPYSLAFKILFRKIHPDESQTCVECRMCFDDKALGARRTSIAFRPDKTSGGGLVAVKDMFKKADEIRERKRLARAAAEALRRQQEQEEQERVRVAYPPTRIAPMPTRVRVSTETDVELAAIEAEQAEGLEAAKVRLRIGSASGRRKLTSKERGKLRRKGHL